MAEWMDWVSFVASIFGIVGVTGVVLTIWSFCLDRQKRAAEADLGRVCCDREKMGYFAIDEPKWWKRKFWKNVALPVVPTLSAIIEAGDELAFTSALFDSIPPNHEEVCWKPIYERFYDELAWTKSAFWDVLKPAEDHVNVLRSYSWDDAKTNSSEGEVRDLEKQIRKRPYLDRHLLYGTTMEGGPHLIKCVMPLSGEDSTCTLDRVDKLWIYNRQPCLEASAYDATALAFILGMYLECRTSPLIINGYGALVCQ
jgi:hypothetical protein